MPTSTHREPTTERPVIVVFRALPGLGDFMCAVPTLRALRAARPDADLHLVGLPSTRPLAERFRANIDVFHPFPGYPGLPEQPPRPRALVELLGYLQALRPELAIQLHGSGDRTNDIVELFGARHVAGSYRAGERCPDPTRFLLWHDEEPEVHRGLRLVSLLGWPADDDRLEFPLDPAARQPAAALLEEFDGAPYVVVHPGANRAVARWSLDGFREVAGALDRGGHRIVVSGAPSERALTAAVAGGLRGAIDLGGRTGLDELGWVLLGSRLLVGNDTGVSHLAVALGVRSVVVFTDPVERHWRRWAPTDGRRHRRAAGSAERVLAEAGHLLRLRESAT
jgi:ADP-heptose:LPS heptosyltransferase